MDMSVYPLLLSLSPLQNCSFFSPVYSYNSTNWSENISRKWEAYEDHKLRTKQTACLVTKPTQTAEERNASFPLRGENVLIFARARILRDIAKVCVTSIPRNMVEVHVVKRSHSTSTNRELWNVLIPLPLVSLGDVVLLIFGECRGKNVDVSCEN